MFFVLKKQLMIHDTLSFLCTEVNKYFNLKLGNTTDPRLRIGNASRALDDSLSGANSLKDKAILTLVNVEEDRVARQQENFSRGDVGTIYKQPPLYLNLYILFSINKDDYKDTLIWLSYIMQFFQHQKVFTPTAYPNLDSGIQKIMVDLFNLNFEQVNHLWSTMGGKYLPSVMYKVRQITVDEDLTTGESGFIKEIQLSEKMKLPAS